MSDKKKGLYQKYEVKKITNPDKVMDCIVLEWDDPRARKGIRAFAEACQEDGFHALAADLFRRLSE